MAKVLYITANPKAEENSYSLSVGRQFINKYKANHPEDEVEEIDVFSAQIPLIDNDVINGWGKLVAGKDFNKLSDDEKLKIARINNIVDNFIAADKYVIVNPMWNFNIPPKLKAYIDTISIANKTFKYTPNGPVGLLTNKKAVHIQASGGIYSQEPANKFEFADNYIKAILNFLGVRDVESIIIEGVNMFPEKAEEIKQEAIAKAKILALKF